MVAAGVTEKVGLWRCEFALFEFSLRLRHSYVASLISVKCPIDTHMTSKKDRRKAGDCLM
jgi:hypothetical protein